MVVYKDGSSKQEAKRGKIFRYLRASQERAGLQVENSTLLICPICWQHIQYRYLTLEHIIPKALSGRRETLTCEGCNARAGKELDPHFVGYHKYEEAMNGRGSLSTELDLNGQRLVANMSRDLGKPSLDFRVVAKATSDAAIATSQHDMKQGKVHGMNVTFNMGFDDGRRRVAQFKAAYLAVFHRFGYELAMRNGMQQVRRLILKCSDAEIPGLTRLVGEMTKLPDFLHDRQVSFLPAQFAGKAFVWAIMKCRIETAVFRLVVLPIDEVDSQLLAALDEEMKENSRLALKGLRPDHFVI